jgi:hypothetical protein
MFLHRLSLLPSTAKVVVVPRYRQRRTHETTSSAPIGRTDCAQILVRVVARALKPSIDDYFLSRFSFILLIGSVTGDRAPAVELLVERVQGVATAHFALRPRTCTPAGDAQRIQRKAAKTQGRKNTDIFRFAPLHSLRLCVISRPRSTAGF